jgi:hypothetical protein
MPAARIAKLRNLKNKLRFVGFCRATSLSNLKLLLQENRVRLALLSCEQRRRSRIPRQGLE